MSLTEIIEGYINELFEASNETAAEDRISLRRKDVAERFGCVPSQINYVLRSRFTPERGYLVESQRGGNGYIRIVRINYDGPEDWQHHIDEIVGNMLTEQEAHRLLGVLQKRGLISTRERLLMEISLRHIEELADDTFDISPYRRNVLQADLLKRMLLGLNLL